MKKTNLNTLLRVQRGHLNKLSAIVQQAIEEEGLIMDKISHPEKEKVSLGQEIADWITWFSGSTTFLFLNAAFFALWIFLNTVPMGIDFFDPYPFGLLTMIVSLEAIFLSCFVLISQNRQEEKDRERGENDYLINLKAELEVRSLHEKMDLLLQEQVDTQAQQLKMLGNIEKKLLPAKTKAKKSTKK